MQSIARSHYLNTKTFQIYVCVQDHELGANDVEEEEEEGSEDEEEYCLPCCQ